MQILPKSLNVQDTTIRKSGNLLIEMCIFYFLSLNSEKKKKRKEKLSVFCNYFIITLTMLSKTWIIRLNSRDSSDHNYYTNGRDSLILLQESLKYQFCPLWEGKIK